MTFTAMQQNNIRVSFLRSMLSLLFNTNGEFISVKKSTSNCKNMSVVGHAHEYGVVKDECSLSNSSIPTNRLTTGRYGNQVGKIRST